MFTRVGGTLKISPWHMTSPQIQCHGAQTSLRRCAHHVLSRFHNSTESLPDSSAYLLLIWNVCLQMSNCRTSHSLFTALTLDAGFLVRMIFINKLKVFVFTLYDTWKEKEFLHEKQTFICSRKGVKKVEL